MNGSVQCTYLPNNVRTIPYFNSKGPKQLKISDHFALSIIYGLSVEIYQSFSIQHKMCFVGQSGSQMSKLQFV